jgi:hypothetical protein
VSRPSTRRDKAGSAQPACTTLRMIASSPRLLPYRWSAKITCSVRGKKQVHGHSPSTLWRPSHRFSRDMMSCVVLAAMRSRRGMPDRKPKGDTIPAKPHNVAYITAGVVGPCRFAPSYSSRRCWPNSPPGSDVRTKIHVHVRAPPRGGPPATMDVGAMGGANSFNARQKGV